MGRRYPIHLGPMLTFLIVPRHSLDSFNVLLLDHSPMRATERCTQTPLAFIGLLAWQDLLICIYSLKNIFFRTIKGTTLLCGAFFKGSFVCILHVFVCFVLAHSVLYFPIFHRAPPPPSKYRNANTTAKSAFFEAKGWFSHVSQRGIYAGPGVVAGDNNQTALHVAA